MLPAFGLGAGLPWLATNDHVRNMAEASAVLDAEIGGCIHLLYHPSLLTGRFCPDASPSGAAGMSCISLLTIKSRYSTWYCASMVLQ